MKAVGIYSRELDPAGWEEVTGNEYEYFGSLSLSANTSGGGFSVK